MYKGKKLLLSAAAVILFAFGFWAGSYWEREAGSSPEHDLSEAPAEMLGEEGACTDLEEEESLFPLQVGDLRLTAEIRGEEALHIVTDFLGENSEIENCYIPSYRDGERDVMIWMVEMTGAEVAGELFKLMKERIQESPSFDKLRPLELEGLEEGAAKEILHAEMSRDNPFYNHFFFNRQEWVYWVMVSGEEAVDVMADLYREALPF